MPYVFDLFTKRLVNSKC